MSLNTSNIDRFALMHDGFSLFSIGQGSDSRHKGVRKDESDVEEKYYGGGGGGRDLHIFPLANGDEGSYIVR